MTSADEAYQMLEAAGNGDAEFWRSYGVIDSQTDVVTSPVFLLRIYLQMLVDHLFPRQPMVEEIDQLIATAADRAPRAAAVLNADYARAWILAYFGDTEGHLILHQGSMEQPAALATLLGTAAGLSEDRIRDGLNAFEEQLSAGQSASHPAHDEVMELREAVESVVRQMHSRDPSAMPSVDPHP